MIYLKDNKLILATKQIKYTENNEEIIKPIGEEGIEWYEAFEKKWDKMKIVEVTDIEYTKEQLARFEEIKELDVSLEVMSDYVLEGKVGEGLEHLKEKQLTKIVSQLALENSKKDMMLEQLTKTVAELMLKGGK